MKPPSPVIAPVLVGPESCVQALGVHWRPLARWCREHGIQICRIGRRPVVSVAAVVAALEGRSAPVEYDESTIIELAARRKVGAR